jgi:Domain of unknown function (DUF5134)
MGGMANMPGMSAMASLSGRGGGLNLLPAWLGVVMAAVFLAIFVNHLRHALESSAQRRLWHVGHVAMALGMAFMFAPASLDPFAASAVFWQATFVGVLVLLAGWLARQALLQRGASGLWVLLAIESWAMLYMWSPGAMQTPLSWLLIAYLAVESGLWTSGRVLGVDRDVLPSGGYDFAGGGRGIGVLRVAATTTLACERDLRVTMTVMTLGMAYMVFAMQVMH